ncbi:MAG: nucleoside kinase [Clostridia bacterium]|nr:nucleoside kinase [Clostridia bacterium]
MNKTNENSVVVTFEDSRKVKVPYKTKVIDVLKLVENDLSDILAVKINNEVRSYDYEIVMDSTCDFVELSNEDGYRIYSRTLKMILYMALTKLFSSAKVEFIATIARDQYFVVKNITLTNEKIAKIKSKMEEIISCNLPILRKMISYEEAEVLYKASGDEVKLENMSNKLKSYITMYFCDGMYNSFYGALAPYTGYVKKFDLLPYKNGAILVIPDKSMNLVEHANEVKENRLYESFIEFNKLNEKLGIDNVAKLNEKVLKNKDVEIIQMSEAIHQRQLVELVLDIEKKQNVKMILIAGPSSSGKTTFAQKLGVQLSLTGFNPITISMDNYFKERKDTPIGPDGKYDFERVDALDVDLFNNQMKDLILGKTVELPKFDFVQGKKVFNGRTLKLKERDILIIEGIHALNPILTEFTDNNQKYKIYISPIATLNIDGYTKISSTDTRILRRMVRDYTTRGHSVEKTFDLWPNVKKGEEKYIFPFVNEVDYIYNSSLVYEPCVIKNYAQPLLLQVKRTSVYYSESRRLYEFLNNFLAIGTENIPIDSLMREFIGSGCFDR